MFEGTLLCNLKKKKKKKKKKNGGNPNISLTHLIWYLAGLRIR